MKFQSNSIFNGTITANSVADAGTNTDKFLVLNSSGVVTYRTAAELYADLGVGSSSAAYTAVLKHPVKAGEAINKGQAVYVSSANGTNMIVTKASNATEATSSKTMGLLETTLALNGIGNVVTEGLLAGLDTTGATNAGDPVWLGTGGNLIYGLINKPYAPAHLVFIGIVTRINANNGEIFVKVQNGFELKEIHDVDLITTTPVNGHILGYNGTLWVNKTIASWLGYTPANAATYVPYTGATGAVNIGAFDLSADNILLGSGLAALTRDAVNGIGVLRLNRGASGYIKPTTLSVDRNYTLPDASGTIALTSDIPSLAGYVPTSRTLTINGVAYDLSADRSWTITAGISSVSGTAPISVSTVSGAATVSIATANTTTTGALTSTDWNTFNGKQATITLTVTGSSGAATLVSNTLNIPTYTLAGLGGVATSRTLTINGTAYDLSADRSWTIDSTSASTRTIQKFTATSGQTTFTITGGYAVGMVDVYMNGVKLDNATDFTASNGTTVVLAAGALTNSVIEVYKFGSQFIPNNALRVVTSFTATAAQTTFTVNYSVGLVDVFYNGSNLAQSEYTATNGTTVVLATACQVNDIVVVYAYSYSVGAYSGIGGSGTTNYLSKFTGTNTIGNSLIFDNGTNVGINSSTFTFAATGRTNLVLNGTTDSLFEFQNNAINSAYLFSTATGFEINATGSRAIQFNTNSAERMRINSAGNVLIGTTTFDNGGFSSSATGLNIFGGTPITLLKESSTNRTFYMALSGNAFIGTRDAIATVFLTSDIERMRITSGGQIYTSNAPAGDWSMRVIGSSVTSSSYGFKVLGGTNANDDSMLVTNQNGANAYLRIRGDGNVSINALAGSTNYKLGVTGAAYIEGTNSKGIFFTDQASHSSIVGINSAISAYNSLELRASGTDGQLFLITSGNVSIKTKTDFGYALNLNGQPGANGYTAWTNWSDSRLKENITDLETSNVLDKICAIRPVTYNYNELSGFDEATRARRISGFIAQELMEVFPDMVGTITKEDGKEYYDTNLSNLDLYLVKAIQELYKKLQRNNIN